MQQRELLMDGLRGDLRGIPPIRRASSTMDKNNPSRPKALLQTLRLLLLIVMATCLALATPGMAQQTGSITGTVSGPDGALPGVTIEADGDVLPRSRVVVTGEGGRYTMRLLPPGNYTLTYTLDGLETETRELVVQLQQTSTVNVELRPDRVAETITVTAAATPIDLTSPELKAAVTYEAIDKMPLARSIAT